VAEFARKVLWAVGMTTTAMENRVRDHALACGADAVCIRTTNARLPAAIARFHTAGLKVYGWRWPAVQPSSVAHHFAIDEANYVATELIPRGLDGYITDPESDTGRLVDDWNQNGLGTLASDYCSIIREAGGTGFPFGLTSGCKYPTNRPKIPWSRFVGASDALFPQTYWRARLGPASSPTDINGGTPKKAIERGTTSWTPIADGKPIVPMAGEIDINSPAELVDYGDRVKAMALDQFHFYADVGGVTAARLAAIAGI
jgi:hypothetical protein